NWPRKRPLDRYPGLGTKAALQRGIAKNAVGVFRELLWGIADHESSTVLSGQALGADRRRDNSFPHRPGFEDLKPPFTRTQQRHDNERCPLHERSDIIDCAGERHAVAGE